MKRIGVSYEGDFKEDKKIGNCVITFVGKERYEGTLDDNEELSA